MVMVYGRLTSHAEVMLCSTIRRELGWTGHACHSVQYNTAFAAVQATDMASKQMSDTPC
jgi:hypothetical protein